MASREFGYLTRTTVPSPSPVPRQNLSFLMNQQGFAKQAFHEVSMLCPRSRRAWHTLKWSNFPYRKVFIMFMIRQGLIAAACMNSQWNTTGSN